MEEGEGGRRSGKARVVDQTAGMTERGFHTLKYLSVGSTRARRSGCAGGSPTEGSPFGTHRSGGERAREPRGAHPSLTRSSPWLTLLARCKYLKRHGVGEREGELGADFSFYCPAKTAPFHLSEKGRLNPFHAYLAFSPIASASRVGDLELWYLALPIPETIG